MYHEYLIYFLLLNGVKTGVYHTKENATYIVRKKLLIDYAGIYHTKENAVYIIQKKLLIDYE